MMKMNGIKEKQMALDRFAKEYQSVVRKELIDFGSQMTVQARSDHPTWTTRSGASERSIAAEVPKDKMQLIFGIIGDATKTKKGISYTTFLHEGTYLGYKQSKAAEKYVPKQPKSGYGIKADHFIVRAWDNFINKLTDNVKNVVIKMAKEAF